jgi:hypothetical protein
MEIEPSWARSLVNSARQKYSTWVKKTLSVSMQDTYRQTKKCRALRLSKMMQLQYLQKKILGYVRIRVLEIDRFSAVPYQAHKKIYSNKDKASAPDKYKHIEKPKVTVAFRHDANVKCILSS